MAQIRILIIEDDFEQTKALIQFLEKNGYDVINVASNLKDALGYFYSQDPDIVLIDIYLDGKPDGIAFAEKINQNPNTTKPFIFLTSYTDIHTFNEAKLTQPYSYLVKPFNPLELQYAIELAIEKFMGETGSFSHHQHNAILDEKCFFVKSGEALIKLPLHDLFYIEVDGRYSLITARQGSFLIQKSLKNLADRLPSQQFVRIHRNFIVNMNEIDKIHLADQQALLKNGKAIPFSQNFKHNLIQRFEVLK